MSTVNSQQMESPAAAEGDEQQKNDKTTDAAEDQPVTPTPEEKMESRAAAAADEQQQNDKPAMDTAEDQPATATVRPAEEKMETPPAAPDEQKNEPSTACPDHFNSMKEWLDTYRGGPRAGKRKRSSSPPSDDSWLGEYCSPDKGGGPPTPSDE